MKAAQSAQTILVGINLAGMLLVATILLDIFFSDPSKAASGPGVIGATERGAAAIPGAPKMPYFAHNLSLRPS
jgi:hypothetical protein